MENLLDYDQKGTSHVGRGEYLKLYHYSNRLYRQKGNKSSVQTFSQLFHLTTELVADALHFVVRLVFRLSEQAYIHLFISCKLISFTSPFLSSLLLSFFLFFLFFSTSRVLLYV